MILRPYQNQAITDLRTKVRNKRSIMLQLATGGGKTAIVSQIVFNAISKGSRVWFIVPRNELMQQASSHFLKWNISHGLISAKSNESLAYNCHIVSKDTLIRRYDKIKHFPDILIFDEAHLYLDRQKEIVSHLQNNSKIIGVTATPELLSGVGLGRKSPLVFEGTKTVSTLEGCPNGLYEDIVYGPSIAELVEMNYLSNIKYFCPPLEGLENVHKKGTEFDEVEIEELLEKRKVYGDAINHYKQYADGKPALVFCRSVKSAAETAVRYNEAGYVFENIDGNMLSTKRAMLIRALKTGEIQGLTSCEILTYGFDCPSVKCITLLRPTMSRALFFQMVGRGLRPLENNESCIVLDHVNLLKTHGHPLDPYDWNFYGREKRKIKGEAVASLKVCPKCFMHYTGTICPNCSTERDVKKREDLEEVDGRLIEIEPERTKLRDRPLEERREYTDNISSNIAKYKEAELKNSEDVKCDAVKELIKLADELGRPPISVYYQLTRYKHAVDVPLLFLIQKLANYKNGWAYFQKKQIEEKIR